MNEQKSDKRIFTMAEEKPVKAVLKMGIPVTMGMLFMVVYNLVDTYFVGLLHNDYQLAATNLAYPVMMVMVAIAGIVGNGGASYIARCIGAGKREEAQHTLTIGFELIVISGVLISIFGLLFLNPIVTVLGAKENTFAYTKAYCMVMFIGAVFTKSEQVIAIGTKTLRAFMLMLPFVGSTSIARNTFNAIGKPMFSFGITVVRQLLLYIPFLLFFNKMWGYTDLIHAQPVEECICMVCSLSLLITYLKQYEK